MSYARILIAFCMALVLALLPHASFAQTSAAPYQSATRFDLSGQVTGTISAPVTGSSGPFLATRTTYDGSGRPSVVEEGSLSTWQADTVSPSSWGAAFTLGRVVETTFDILNRKLTEKVKGSDGNAVSLTQYSYDTAGRLECTAVRMNPATWGALPASACVQTGTPPACTDDTAIVSASDDRITRNVYDNAGQLLKVQKAYATCLQEDYASYTYSDNGKVTSMTDAKGYKASMTYDGFDRQTQWNFPSPTTPGVVSITDYETYTYDANGNRLTLRKRDETVLTYSYDNLNRMIRKTVPERAGLAATHTRDVYYGYDLRGLMTYARFDNATGEGITMTYDAFGRVSGEYKAMDGSWMLGSGYDANGNRTSFSYADGQGIWASYDPLNRPIAIWRNNSHIAVYSYNNQGQREWQDNANGMRTGYGYDPAGRLMSLYNNFYNNPAQGAWNNFYSYAYNPAGQITARASATDTFSWTGHYYVDRSYTANGLNQYTAAGSANFTYDANGNLTSDGSTTFIYDTENRLVGATGAKSATLRYDPLGRLHEVSSPSGTTRFIWDGNALTMEYDGAGNILRRYVHGSDAKVDDPIAWYEGSAMNGSNERWLRSDERGSVVAVSTATTVLAVNRYDEYGIPQSSNAGRFQYTGQAWIAELGMYYYKARIYSPTLGRFLQTDPIGYEDQVNLYAYVGNDPVNKTDPDGQESADHSLRGLAAIEADEREHPGDPAARKAVVLTAGAAVSCVFGCRLVPTAFRAIKDALTGKGEAAATSGAARTTARVNPDGKTFTDATGRTRTPTTGGPGAGKRISSGTRAAERDAAGGRCIYCGNRTDTPHGDHIAPRNPKGGGERGNNSPENTGNSCPQCNGSKSNWNPIEWIERTFGINLYDKTNKGIVPYESRRLARYGRRMDLG